ncbi:hypothetical protein BIV57_19775 [Mangrovactinospora gilvigrisea]|uniref:Uncharacterized protein n=1 Tax=Mangrovactinospora gilvigrisea TaxID=1428644 RepID=A0A1J7C817_9ACTN|nr:hypothetical protein BIV57_19775 [Mangrovactinospora gilvigrisea]
MATVGEATILGTEWLVDNAAFAHASEASLDRSGKVGQTFSAANAMFSGLALLAVATTVLMQRRELRMQRAELTHLRQHNGRSNHELHRTAEAMIRGNHFELIRLAIEHPHLADVWPAFRTAAPLSEERRAQFLYANLVLSHGAMALGSGQLSESELRAEIRHYFRSPVIVEFWRAVRLSRLSRPIIPESPFDRLMDLEFHRLPGSP